jgi:hypothetical protein
MTLNQKLDQMGSYEFRAVCGILTRVVCILEYAASEEARPELAAFVNLRKMIKDAEGHLIQAGVDCGISWPNK